jgi:glycosyltransferase involved in cell wall biosynthesis
VIAVSSSGAELMEVKDNEGVRTFSVEMSRSISPFKDLVSIFKLFILLKRERPYIIHSHTPKAGFVAMIAGYLAGVPHRLHTVAGLPLMEVTGIKKNLLLSVEKLTYLLATLVFPNSYGLKDYIIEKKLTSERKLRVLGNGSSNGIDLNYFRPTQSPESVNELKTRYELNGKFTFLFIGRIVGPKGINELVSAFSDLNKEYKETILLLVGNFEEDLYPLSDLTRLQLQNPSIRVIGYQSDVRPFLEVADVFVFPSYREGFPNSVLQACAYNLPCIVTDINGCNEIISDKVNGLLIPPKNVEELYSSMDMLYLNEGLRREISSGNRILVEERFGQFNVWSNILNMYNSL